MSSSTMKQQHNTLIIMARAPLITRVKSRLAPELNQRQRLHFHRASLNRLLALTASGDFALRFYQSSSSPLPSAFARSTVHRLQQGYDLGERMQHAIEAELKVSQRVCLIGSDCLQLGLANIERAFALLAERRSVVFTPANDGGYVLVGLRQTCPALFKSIRWGTNDVLQKSIKRATQQGRKVSLMPALVDVDTYKDIEHLQQKSLHSHLDSAASAIIRSL